MPSYDAHSRGSHQLQRTNTALSGESKTHISHIPTPLTLCRAHLAVGFAVCRSWMDMREEREESEQVKAAPFPCLIHVPALQHLSPALPSPWLMKAAGPSHNWALLFRVEYMMLKSFSPALSRFSSSSRSSAMQPTSSSSFSFFFLPRVHAVWLGARPPNPYWG